MSFLDDLRLPTLIQGLRRAKEDLNWHMPEGIVPTGRRRGPHVLARALCRYRFFPYPEVPLAERHAAQRMRVLAWSPFQESDFAVCQTAEGWMVFAWDAAEYRMRCQEAGIHDASLRAVPESCWWPALGQGAHLWRCRIGYEGQVWRNGALLASRWWQEPPAGSEWDNFLRVAGEPAGGFAPDVAEPEWSGRMWHGLQRIDAAQQTDWLRWRWLLASVVLAMLGATGYQARQWLDIALAIARDNRALESKRAAAAPLLEAREAALRDLALLEAWQGALKRPPVPAMLGDILRRLPDNAGGLREAEFANGRWRLLLQPPASSSRILLIQALEASPLLKDVRQQSGGYGAEGIVVLAHWRGANEAAGSRSEPRLRENDSRGDR